MTTQVTRSRKLWLALLVAVSAGAAACQLVAYDVLATGRDLDRELLPDGGQPSSEDGGGGEDAGPADSGSVTDLDGGDFGYAAHAEPGWPMPDSATKGKCAKVDFLDGGYFDDTCPTENERYYGQDSQTEVNKPSYDTTTDARVVIDSVTHLMWQRQIDVGRQRTWEEARNYCFTLELAGLDDWRLPTRVELVSILDFGRESGPMIEPSAFSSTPAARFWTLSPYGADDAWYVSFDANDVQNEAGGEAGIVTHTAKSQKGFVRCVR